MTPFPIVHNLSNMGNQCKRKSLTISQIRTALITTRAVKRLTLDDVATRIKVSRAMIHFFEHGKKMLGGKNLVRLAAWLDVDIKTKENGE